MLAARLPRGSIPCPFSLRKSQSIPRDYVRSPHTNLVLRPHKYSLVVVMLLLMYLTSLSLSIPLSLVYIYISSCDVHEK